MPAKKQPIKKTIRYGWKRDLPDKRDFLYESPKPAISSSVDLSPQMAAPYDQGNLGSCTAQAMAAIYQFTFRENKRKNFMPSRLKIYYDERVLEGTVKYDAGAMLRTGMKVLAKHGVCVENLWTYDDSAGRNAKFLKRPVNRCYVQSRKHKALKYCRVGQNEQALCGALAANDPVVFGFAVYESFVSDAVSNTGIVPMPDFRNESMLGGHAVVLAGYDSGKRVFLVRNSWGIGWGSRGYFTMPFEYVLDPWLSADFWALKVVV